MRYYIALITLLFCLPAVAPAQPPVQSSGVVSTGAVSTDADHTDEQLAAQYFREGRYDRAVVLYEELFDKRPTLLIYNNYLVCLLELEDHRKAERLVRGQIRQHPRQLRYEVDLGWVMEKAGNGRQARRHYDGLIDGLQAVPEVVIDLAVAFENRGMPDRAIEACLQGRKLLGSSYSLHLRLAALYEGKGDYRAMMNEYIGYLEGHLMEMERVRGMLQDAIVNDPNNSRNDALRAVLLARSQSHPDNTLYSEMLLWLSLQQKDFRMAFMQSRALDRRFRENGERVLEVARLSLDNKTYDVAVQAYQYVVDKGMEAPLYLQGLVGLLDTRFQKVVSSYGYSRNDLLKVEQEYQEALALLGINTVTVQLLRNLARLQAFYLGNTGEAIDLLGTILEIPQVANRIKAECRIELADILLHTGQVWDATLLYAEVDKTFRDDPIGHEARYKNARLSFYIGEFDWARAQLDVLKAATSRLIANDAMKLSLKIQDNVGSDGNTEALMMYARAEKLIFMNRRNEALAVLDSMLSLFPSHPIFDDVLYAKAEIHLHQGDYDAADKLLSRITEQFPTGLLADEALLRRAVLHEEVFNDKEMAMSLYQKIMFDYPGSLNNLTARNRFRSLRGNLIN